MLGINMNYINISFIYIFPILLYSDDFTPPSLSSFMQRVEISANSVEKLSNREVLDYLSIDDNLKNYKYEDIVKLRNRLDSYLSSSKYYSYSHKNNSTIVVSDDVTVDNSEITNMVERLDSTISNSNIGVIIDENIDNSTIENKVDIVNSTVNNSNVGIKIGENRSSSDSYGNSSQSREEVKSNTIRSKGNTIINHVKINDSTITGDNNNFGISIGN